MPVEIVQFRAECAIVPVRLALPAVVLVQSPVIHAIAVAAPFWLEKKAGWPPEDRYDSFAVNSAFVTLTVAEAVAVAVAGTLNRRKLPGSS